MICVVITSLFYAEVLRILNLPTDGEGNGEALGLIFLIPLFIICVIPTVGVTIPQIVLSSIAIGKHQNRKPLTIIELIYSVFIVLLMLLFVLYLFIGY